MKKWNLIVDVAECHNCHNCFVTCKDEYVGNDFPGYSAPQPLHGHRWIDILAKERGRFPRVEAAYVPIMCNHCDNAPCVAAGRGAVVKREDGIVLIDPRRAKGRKDLVGICPYGAIWWNEELQLPQAWTFDAHLIDSGWDKPRCVQACPTGALQSLKVSDEEMSEIVAANNLRPLVARHATRPRVHYKNLHLYDRLFIAGTVLAESAGVVDCLGEAQIELIKEAKVVSAVRSDAFGEFKIDSLLEDSGACELRILHPDFAAETVAVTLGKESLVLDPIPLKKTAPR
ncbi:MAG: oxidoreductase [Bradyrhizobiaceae bacterium]|nr:oxidoreductase [Bradyrhizobiaceae bacterium]